MGCAEVTIVLVGENVGMAAALTPKRSPRRAGKLRCRASLSASSYYGGSGGAKKHVQRMNRLRALRVHRRRRRLAPHDRLDHSREGRSKKCGESA